MRATEAIGRIGAAFYFRSETVACGKEAGLDGFRFYVLGRGGVLGDVESDVVRAAFGYFHPGLVAKMWNSAREVMAPRDAARLYIGCAHDLGRAQFGDIEGLDGFVEAATQVIGSVEGISMPLFAAVRAEPVPDDTPAAAMHQAMVLRELRGSVHLLAIAAQALKSEVAHAIRRPDDIAMFGWTEPPEVSDQDHDKWHDAERLTDELLDEAYSSLGAEQIDALVSGTEAMAAALGV